MTISTEGRNAIKGYENLRLFAYLPTPADKPTIGWGHCGPEVFVGMEITISEADEMLSEDCKTVEGCLDIAVDVPLSQNQYDALGCLAFNVGVGAFLRSHLRQAINSGDLERTRNNWLDWDHQGGVVLPGLKARREKELSLFAEGR